MNLRLLLLPLSWLYGFLQRRDRARRETDVYRSRLPVISVGNLSVGGAGKTPVVAWIVARLKGEHRLAILARGYGRRSREDVILDLPVDAPDPDLLGDEPAMLAGMMADALPGSVLAVGPDRAALLRSVDARAAGRVVILDDGFQGYGVARDLDIVLVDERTVENPHLIPAGDLREPPRALARAQVILASCTAAESFARRYMSGEALLFRYSGRACGLVSCTQPGTAYNGEPALLVTGIARSRRVLESLRTLGVEARAHLRFRDHRRYDAGDAERIAGAMMRCGARVVVTTQKDAVKLRRFPRLCERMFWIDYEVAIEREEELVAILQEAARRGAGGGRP
ncbi:MAG TPA: tetraacyldisaccharide 4'-kinase [Candidatus Kapabacteria bacterium]|nr:tetraacyldisaccharide 4'-kinase [Candidatus Kapabacteria bacterium]